MAKTQLDILIEIATKNQKAVADITEDLSGLDKVAKESGLGLVKLDSALNLLGRGMGVVTGLASKFTGALKSLGAEAKSMAQEAAQVNAQITTLGIIAKARGEDVEGFQRAAEEMGRELRIGTGPAAESLQKLMKAGLNIDQATELLKRFTNEALTGKVSTMSLSEAVTNLAGGYQMEISALMDRAGISENIGALMQKEADLRGITIAQLDEAGRAQLKYDAFIRLTNETLGSAEQFQGTYIDKQAQITNSIEETRREIGQKLLPIFELFQDIQIGLIRILTPSQEAFDKLGDAIKTVTSEVGEVIGENEEFIEITEKLSSLISDFIVNIADWLLVKWEALRVAIETNDEAMQEIWARINNELIPAFEEFITINEESEESLGEWVDKVLQGISEAATFTSNIVELVNAFKELLSLKGELEALARVFSTLQTGGLNLLAERALVGRGATRAEGFAKGGIVPKYAANGMFVPRGTDTVPAMLTPGELVVPRNLTQRLADFIDRAGSFMTGTVTVNIAVQSDRQAEMAGLSVINSLENYQLGS